jgi:predicted ATPase
MADGLRYQLVCGMPETNDLPTSFKLDPLIKEESVAFRDRSTAVTLLDRGKSGAMLRDADGTKVSLPMTLARSESALTQIAEPHRYPYLTVLRDRLTGWRFYQHFRTDEHAPVRQPQVGVFSPVLSHDGHDLAAALQTIREIGDADGLYRAVRQGVDGAELIIVCPDGPDAHFRVQLRTPGILRPLEAWELSDGTLRYLCLLAALLSPRPPALLALNEPEASLHPDLLTPLAALVAQAAARSQVWLTTHSTALADAVAHYAGIPPIRLKKVDGETRVV